MKSIFFLQIFFAGLLINVSTQGTADEFTFGGAAEEEEEGVPEIKFSEGDNKTLVKYEMQFLNVTATVIKLTETDYVMKWLNKEGKTVSTNKFLFIKSLVKDVNEGQYLYEIERKADKKKFNKTLDLEIKIPAINITIQPEEVLKIGGRVLRKCSDLYLPQSTVVDTFSYEWVDQNNKVVSRSNMLNIQIKDTTVNGPYECRYISTTTSKVYKAQTNVIVSRDYTIEIIPQPKEFSYKAPFALKCNIPDYTGPVSFIWKRNNQFLSTNQTINIDSYDETTFGLYKCEATLDLATGKKLLEAQSLHQIIIQRDSKIELSERPGPIIYVHKGDKKELHCEIETKLKLAGRDAKWYINGKLFTTGSVDNVKRLDRRLVSILVINPIDKKNEGKYECYVGESVKEVTLKVILPPGIIETNPPLLEVKEGEPVEYHCRIDNIPNVKNIQLKWRFRSKDGKIEYGIPNNRWNKLDSEAAELTSFINLDSAMVSDNGYLICTEPNGLTAQSELVVIAKPKPRAVETVITITPKEVSVRPFQRIEIQCFAKTATGQPTGNPQFYFLNKTKVDTDPRYEVSTVGPSRIQLTIEGGLPLTDNNLCIVCSTKNKEVNATIFIKDICPPDYRYCRNGQCLENSKFCDGKVDCTDGSDENPDYCNDCDPVSKQCKDVGNQTARRKYFLAHWACDGDDDCGNGYDEIEANCDQTLLNECGGKYFVCQDGKKIPKGFQCDQTSECSKGEDETGCTQPQFLKTSNTTIYARKSHSVSIMCEVVGKPLPMIIWRFNWKCLPTDGRFITQTSISNCTALTSTLTINNFKPGDDGIYSCEALGATQRLFSPDFHLMMLNN